MSCMNIFKHLHIFQQHNFRKKAHETCRFWREGKCQKGDYQCNFVHGFICPNDGRCWKENCNRVHFSQKNMGPRDHYARPHQVSQLSVSLSLNYSAFTLFEDTQWEHIACFPWLLKTVDWNDGSQLVRGLEIYELYLPEIQHVSSLLSSW